MSLLDVGCGPGTITAGLARRVAPGRVVGVDRSRGVLQSAATLIEPRSVIGFEVADLYALPFENCAFDVVHAHQVLQHLDDPVAGLQEMARVCRHDGLIAVRDGDYASMTWFPEYPEITRWLDLYRRTARANSGEPDAGRRLMAWAGLAACRDVVPSASVWCFATQEDRSWWADTWAERISTTALAQQIVEHGFAEEAELHGIAAGWRRWADEPDGWFSVVHGELLCRPG